MSSPISSSSSVGSTVNVKSAFAVTQSALNAHTEQALIELAYVGSANDLLGSALANLESALGTTASVLNILQQLQTLHNGINVTSKSAFLFNYMTGPSSINKNPTTVQTVGPNTPPLKITNISPFPGFPGFTQTITLGKVLDTSTTSTGVTMYTRNTVHYDNYLTDYQAAYLSAASAYFSKITPTFVYLNSSSSGYPAFLSSIKAIKSHLSAEIATLTNQTPLSTRADPTNLLNTVKKVYNNLPTTYTFSAVEKWALDNYTATGSSATATAGNIQNDLTAAITASQSLNDTQKEKVRSFLFVFQEYYTSASAVLTSISQIIQDMAKKVGG